MVGAGGVPVTRVVWCPFATQDILRSGAGSFVNLLPRIVHHTTEGSSYAGARGAYKKTGSLPHFTDSFERGRYEVWQHLPIDQAATALKHPSGKPETNRANAIQIEHVGQAGRAHDFADGFLDGMAVLCRWIETTVGVPRSAPFAFGSGAPRLSWLQWETFAGHFGHCHVPGNDHWDPGALDIDRVLSAGIPQLVPTPADPRPAPGPAAAPIAVIRNGVPYMQHTVNVTVDRDGNGFESTAFNYAGAIVQPRATANPRPPEQGGNGRYHIAQAAGLDTDGKLDVVVMGADPSPDDQHRYVVPILVDIPD